jgi:hypothetical protein
LKSIQKEYDQKGVFPQRTNGFKLTWPLAKARNFIHIVIVWESGESRCWRVCKSNLLCVECLGFNAMCLGDSWSFREVFGHCSELLCFQADDNKFSIPCFERQNCVLTPRIIPTKKHLVSSQDARTPVEAAKKFLQNFNSNSHRNMYENWEKWRCFRRTFCEPWSSRGIRMASHSINLRNIYNPRMSWLYLNLHEIVVLDQNLCSGRKS